MRRSHLACVVLLLAVLLVAAAAPREDKAGGVFAGLEKGQRVALKQTANGFEIGVLPGVDLAFTVKGDRFGLHRHRGHRRHRGDTHPDLLDPLDQGDEAAEEVTGICAGAIARPLIGPLRPFAVPAVRPVSGSNGDDVAENESN